MSLQGFPTGVSERELMDMEAPLIALVNQSGGDLRKLFYAFFSFLHRRTDFYMVPHDDDLKEGQVKMGFREGDAEKLLLAAFRQFPLRKMPLRARPDEALNTNDITSTSAEVATRSDGETATEKKATKQGEVENSALKAKVVDKSDETTRHTEEGLQIPIGNGGSTSRYKWTQTIEECTVLVSLPEDLRGKDLNVELKPTSILVRTKQPLQDESEPRTLLEGTLSGKILPNESSWTIESGVLILLLYKSIKTFWETIVVGDERIDTSLVDSRRRIDEYDEATQAQLRKMIFDQSQTRKGLPTSDEILGAKPKIPPLPPGVEYIDKETLEEKILARSKNDT